MVRKNGLPRRVYLHHGAYYYVDLLRKWHRLSTEKDGMPAMYRALAQLQDAQTGDRIPVVISGWLTTKRPSWSVSQKRNIERVASEISAAFSEFRPGDVTTPDCAEYLGTLADRPRTHNIHRDVLRQVLAYAAVRGLREGHNPVDNISGLSTPGRRRIVTDAEIEAIRASAVTGHQGTEGGRGLLQMLDLALITGQRIGDLINLRWQDVTEAGLMIEQGKTGARLVIEWTPALRAAVDACADGTTRIGRLLKTRTGGPYTYAGMRSAWVRVCKRAGIEDLNIHDLRGRAGVDALMAGDLESARALLGHQTQRMTAHYTRGKHIPKVRPAR